MAAFEIPGLHAGYVVMPLKEYNELREQIDLANREAFKVHSLGAEATLKAKQELSETLNSLCMAERQCWGDKKIVVHFNERALYDVAMQALVRTYSEEELAQYDFIPSEDFCLGDITIGHRKHDAPDV